MSKLRVVEEWFRCFEQRNFEGMRDRYAPGAFIWHNDGSPEQTVAENLALLSAVAGVVNDLRYDVMRRREVDDGVFSQHVLRGKLPDGTELALDAAMFLWVIDGRIQRVEEYIDTAQAAGLVQALTSTLEAGPAAVEAHSQCPKKSAETRPRVWTQPPAGGPQREVPMASKFPVPTDTVDHQTFDRLLSERYSCRGFLPDPVPDKTIEQILRTAQKTASWNNVQSWGVHLTRGEGTERFRKALSERAASGAEHARDIPGPREYAGVYLERRRACGFGLYNAVGVERGDKAGYMRQTSRNFVFFDAPHVAIITSEEALGPYSAVDCGGYVVNFMTAAASLGVATIAQGAVGEYADFIHEHLDIPPSRQVVCGISFGYADSEHPANSFRTDRADLADVVTWVNE